MVSDRSATPAAAWAIALKVAGGEAVEGVMGIGKEKGRLKLGLRAAKRVLNNAPDLTLSPVYSLACYCKVSGNTNNHPLPVVACCARFLSTGFRPPDCFCSMAVF